MLFVFGASTVAALAAAGPALADETQLPEAPPLVEPTVAVTAIDAIPLPALPPPELAEPPLVVTTVDASSVDVSVRVLSPGEEPAEAQESETSLISGEATPDITSPSEEEIVPGEAKPEASEARDVNVSVRILSPGDRGDISQGASGGGEGVVEVGTQRSESSPEPRPASPTHDDSTENFAQYHDNNSAKEFTYHDAEDVWNWTWSLAIDCAGDVVSSSADTGDPASLVWSWSWGWTWGCSDAPTPAPEPSSRPQPPEPRQSDEPAGAPIATETSGEPWAWTWTFSFCGETTTISTNAGAGTPLTWTWDWGWTWFCPLAAPVETTLPPGVDEQPPVLHPAPFHPEPDAAPEVSFPPLWLPSAPPELQAGVATEIVVLPSLEPLEPLIEVVIPGVALPVPTTAPSLPLPELPLPSEAVAGGPTTTAGPSAQGQGTAPRSPQPPSTIARLSGAGTAELPQAAPRAHQARPASTARARGARPHRPLPPIPFDRQQPSQAIGSSSSGGSVPSALLLGVAALAGFILLAAPGLGRRIRLARELSPRSLNESPLDRPG